MVGAHGVGASREDALQLRGRARLGLTGRIRGRAPVTRWPPHLPIQGNLLLELMHVLFRSWVRLDVCMCLFMVHVSMYFRLRTEDTRSKPEGSARWSRSA